MSRPAAIAGAVLLMTGAALPVGFELGLDFPEILRAVGVDRSTWWGDDDNPKNNRWYGPGAPYRYH